MVKREIPVEQAIGMTLAHDLTRIVPGQFKGRAFAKGHVIQPEDVPVLLDIGKRYIYVLEIGSDELHENDAAVIMAEAVAGDGLEWGEVHEGKVVLKAVTDGMLWVNQEAVTAMNLIDGISITTRPNLIHVTKGTSVAGVRPIPLVIEKNKVDEVVTIANEVKDKRSAIDVLPYKMKTAALVTTGSEIQSGRIEDKSGPVLRAKLEAYGIQVGRQVFPGDEKDAIVSEIVSAADLGVDLVLVTGGMSVDPDDRSPASIREAATQVVTYGTPMLPGSMLMLAYRGKTAIFGLPGAVLHDAKTSFDVLLPRVLARMKVTKSDIAQLGVGGWLNE
ncbi:molybdopterin-binding protein [Alicyclobacillus ferrooxydans]|uniref:Molybdopterin molybdenumtransferase n=1 Tax=Alicyclobacillus ferrooxydans TaxID=471514 RepID=A0A0P9CQ67_9BACL|nr:molybdopterin-binding protein [Alicyclobacillus ferrooxydans]KPV45010.1 molybdopterin-binding protein [Alicyclobacillus ferrooxydans]